MRSRKLLQPLVLASLLGTVAGSNIAFAADRTWTNTLGGVFTSPGNWAGALVPGAADRAIFDATTSNSSYTVSFPSNVSNSQLSVSDNVLFSLVGSTYSTTGSSPLRIGDDGVDAGSLTIANGTFSSTSTSLSLIGATTGSNGALTVQSTATLSMGGSLFVGSFASGTLNVNGRYTGTSLAIAGNSSVSGAMNVTGAIANVSLSGTASIGDLGAGTLLFNGDSFSTATMNIGDQSGSSGTFIQTSPASVTTVSGTLRVAQFNNTGVLNLTAGTFNSNGVFIGGSFDNIAGDGTVIIGGGTSAARFNNTGIMRVGTSSSTIGGNGTLIVTGVNAQLSTGSMIAGSLNSNGYIRVQHVGAVINSGVINIGANGRGTLEVLTGGVVNSSTLTVGDALGSVGVLRMSGAGSAINTGTFQFRAASLSGSAGIVDIVDGAALTSGAGFIGAAASSTGTVNVSGTGSVWNSSSTINVGSTSANGHLRVGPGALVSTGSLSTLSINAFGTVDIDGGTLRVGGISKAPTGVLNFGSGTLQITNTGPGGLLEIAPAGPFGDQLQLNPGQNLIGTNVNVNGVLAMRGGRLSSGMSVLPGGHFIIQDPSSVISGIIINSGKVLGSGAIAGTLSNSSAGEVRASLGERLAFTGTATSFNLGQINLIGGEVEFGGTFTNQTAGKVNGRGLLRAPAITNFGTMTYSAGISDVFGNLTNTVTGKTIITGAGNATFYGDVTNGATSEFRVSPGAIATFLGTVNGLSQFTGSGTTIFEGPASFGRISKSGATRVGPFGDLVAEHVRDGRLDIEGSASIVPDGTDAGTSRVNALFIEPGAQLDLANNALVIDYDGASPLSQISAYLASGFAGGAWTGDGINSSIAAMTANLAIGIAEGNAIGSPANFAGQPADATSVLLRFTLPGDADLSGGVNLDDFTRLAAGFGTSSTWSSGDFNYDGVVNLDDFTALAANFGLSLPLDDPRSNLAAAAVPEPGAGLLSLVLITLMNRPRRRRA